MLIDKLVLFVARVFCGINILNFCPDSCSLFILFKKKSSQLHFIVSTIYAPDELKDKSSFEASVKENPRPPPELLNMMRILNNHFFLGVN